MALIATQFTVEIILMIIALYFGFDSGLIRKIVSIGFCAIGITLTLQKQSYVSDLSSQPINVLLNFPGPLQNAITLIFTMIALAIIASAFLDLRAILLEDDETKKMETVV